jgi:hypothetical protein
MQRDTQAEAIAAQLAILRLLGPAGRLRLAVEMSEDVRRSRSRGSCDVTRS